MKIILPAILGIGLAGLLHPATPIRVMILDGESGGPYHKWQLVPPVLRKELEETGLFQVDVATARIVSGLKRSTERNFAEVGMPATEALRLL
jgi:hypothetical protein